MSEAKAAILVVDDDADLREWVAGELAERGFTVQTATSGEHALEVQASFRFDLALIDLQMPGRDGIETLSALKAVDPDIEAIIATGRASVPAAVASMKNGAFDFIQKPYTLRQLVPLLERALEKSRLQGTLALHRAGTALLNPGITGDLLEEGAGLLKRTLLAHSVGMFLSWSPRVAWFPGPGVALPDTSLVASLASRIPAGADGARLLSTGANAVPLGPFGSAIVTALMARRKPVGALVLLRLRGAAPFTEEEYRRALVVSDQLALAADNARLREELAAKAQEVTRTRDALIFAEKLALTGQLAAGVAHELRTPLQYVTFNVDFVSQGAERVLRDLPGDAASPMVTSTRQSLEEIRKALAEAHDGVERIVGIVRDLNMFAQPDRKPPAPIDITKVLDWASNVIWGDIKVTARLIKDYQPAPPVHGNEARLGQVFVNLLMNATQAIGPGAVERNAITLAVHPEGARVIVEVTDSGKGIDPAIVDRIFEPFFTTKPAGTGTGLGLPISRSIVIEHGGTMTVHSEPNHGTTFRVSLPAA
jgi:signal transduction histidine kinase